MKEITLKPGQIWQQREQGNGLAQRRIEEIDVGDTEPVCVIYKIKFGEEWSETNYRLGREAFIKMLRVYNAELVPVDAARDGKGEGSCQ